MSKYRWSETGKDRRNAGWEDLAHKYTPNPFQSFQKSKRFEEISREQVSLHMFSTFFGQSLLYYAKVDVESGH